MSKLFLEAVGDDSDVYPFTGLIVLFFFFFSLTNREQRKMVQASLQEESTKRTTIDLMSVLVNQMCFESLLMGTALNCTSWNVHKHVYQTKWPLLLLLLLLTSWPYLAQSLAHQRHFMLLVWFMLRTTFITGSMTMINRCSQLDCTTTTSIRTKDASFSSFHANWVDQRISQSVQSTIFLCICIVYNAALSIDQKAYVHLRLWIVANKNHI